jgi:hypothetical protein
VTTDVGVHAIALGLALLLAGVAMLALRWSPPSIPLWTPADPDAVRVAEGRLLAIVGALMIVTGLGAVLLPAAAAGSWFAWGTGVWVAVLLVGLVVVFRTSRPRP